MIGAWMIYTVAVTLLLFAAAGATEYVARALRAPTRFIWATAMVAALGLSGRALYLGLTTRAEAPAARMTTPIFVHVDAPTGASTMGAPAGSLADPDRWGERNAVRAAAQAVVAMARSARNFDVTPLEHWNQTLIVLWAVVSATAMCWLAGSLVGLRRIERALFRTVVDDQPVLVSKDVGPALLGIARSRIVIPEWVLSLPKPEREVILAHERQHATARDPALVYAAAFMVALQPWNIPLWALVARLRLALESDCDRRVLGSSGDARRYGQLLVAVYERMTPGLAPYVAFVERPSNLERRIRRITGQPRLGSVAGATAAAGAAVLVLTACTAASPVRRVEAPMPPPVTEPPRVPLPLPTQPEANPEVPRPHSPSNDTAPIPRNPWIDTAPLNAAAWKEHAPVPVSSPPRREESIPAQPPSEGCAMFARATAQWTFGERPGVSNGGWFPGGCSIYGDIIVVGIDSTQILVAARDTADIGRRITAFLVVEARPGSVPLNLAWATTTGRATLSGTSLSFSSPVAGTKQLVFRLGSVTPDHGGPDILPLEIVNVMMMQMRGVAWDAVAQLPTAARCTATERRDPALNDLAVPRGPEPLGNVDRHACFIMWGQRFQFPIL